MFPKSHKRGLTPGKTFQFLSSFKFGFGIYSGNNIEEASSNVAILGRYIINPDIFEILEHTKSGKGGEIQLTDALKELAQKEAMYAHNFEGRRYDVGNKQGFLEATKESS